MEWQIVQIHGKCMIVNTDEKILYSFPIQAEISVEEMADRLRQFRHVTYVDYLGYKYTRKRIPVYRFFVIEDRKTNAPF